MDTGESVKNGDVIPVSTKLRFDLTATSYGSCDCYLDCKPLNSFNLTVNHGYFWETVSTSTSLNGAYVVGRVEGVNAAGGTASYNVLSTLSSNSTGPVYTTLGIPGKYVFQINAINNVGACSYAAPYYDNPIFITVYATPTNNDLNLGPTSCNASVGAPINVTNGNMYFQQGDYKWAATGFNGGLVRTYNSRSTRAGIFGLGMSTALDESITAYGSSLFRLTRADGSAVYFVRQDDGSVSATMPSNFYGSLTIDASGNYSLQLKEGEVHAFSTAGKLVSITDRNGKSTNISYDSSGRPVSVSDAFGRSIALNYASGTSKLVSSISDNLGTAATYSYSSDWPTKVIYPDGSGYSYGWTSAASRGVIANVKDLLGNTIESHTYDSLGRAITSAKHGDVEKLTLSYVSANQTNVVDALGNSTQFLFNTPQNGLNTVTSVTGSCCSSSSSTAWNYDSQYNVTSVVDALGNTRSFTYDDVGNALTATDELGYTTNYTYNSFGQVLSVTDAQGGVSTNQYDSAGNLIQTTLPTGATYVFSYGTHGFRSSETDPRGSTTTFGYDAYGNLTSITDPLGGTSFASYDLRSRKLTDTDQLNNTTSYAYDGAGRLQKTTHPDGSFITQAYDLGGRLISYTDELGRKTTNNYDGAYRLTKTTDPAGKAVSYGYDLMSNLTSITDANTNATTYNYDAYRRLIKTTYPGGAVESAVYDSAGRLASSTNAKGIVTSYAFDATNRLTSKSYSDGSPAVSYSYDELGKLIAASNSADTVSRAYDSASHLLSETSVTNGSVVNHEYDLAGNLIGTNVNGQRILDYSYDAASNLVGIAKNGVNFAFGYDIAGRRTNLSYPNGVHATYSLDNRSRITEISAVGIGQVADIKYTFDAANQVQSKEDLSTLSQYTYDANSRLTLVKQGSVTTESYTYDSVGNRLTSLGQPSWVYNSRNQLVSNGAFSYSYDANGNLVTRSNGAETWSYGWDVENRLSTVSLNGNVVASFSYDPFGRRVRKVTNQVSQNYVYDDEAILSESTPSYARNYVNGPNVDEPLGYQDENGNWSFFHADGLGSIVAGTDASGVVSLQRVFDAFGNWQAGNSANGYSYTGREWDGEVGMYYYRARYYDPLQGRFVSRDPIGFFGGINLYTYVGGNPTGYVDPDGNFGIPGAIAGGVIGGISGALGAAATGGNVWRGAGIGALSGAVVGGTGVWIGASIVGQMYLRFGVGAISNAVGQMQNLGPCFSGFNWGSFLGSSLGGAAGGFLSPGAWGAPFSGRLGTQIIQRAIAGIPGAGVSGTSGIVGTQLGKRSPKCGC